MNTFDRFIVGLFLGANLVFQIVIYRDLAEIKSLQSRPSVSFSLGTPTPIDSPAGPVEREKEHHGPVALMDFQNE